MCKQCNIFTTNGKYYCPESLDHFVYCPFCGEKLDFTKTQGENPEDYETLRDYIKSLDDNWDSPDYEKWRFAIDYWRKHASEGIDDKAAIRYIEEKFNKKTKKK